MPEGDAARDAALAEYPRWIADALQLAPVGIYVTDTSGGILLVNRRWSEITGLDPALARGDGWTRALDPQHADALRMRWREIVAAGQAFSGEFPVLLADGTRRWLHNFAVPIHRGGGGLIGYVGVIADRSEQREVEQAHRTLVENSLQGYLIFQDGRTVFVNRAMTEITGYSAAELIDASPDEGLGRIHPDDRARVGAEVAAYLAGGPPVARSEIRVLHRDGSQRWLELSATSLDYRGRPALQVVYVDVTERRVRAEDLQRMNEELERRVAERTAQLEGALNEIESFSYSVSHDLRAPLRAIDGFSQGLLEDYGDVLDARGRDDLERVRRAAHRMGELIDDLLTLSRVVRSDLTRVPVDLSALAAEVVDDLQRTRPAAVAVVEIAPGLYAHGDRTLLRAALLNLLGNALKFSARRPAPRVIFAAAPGPDPGFVVRDNGVGFDMTYSDKLFRPFQRLHAAEGFEGTGIGLATVQRIIARHGGRIWAESAPDAGAAFYFTLP